MDRTNLPCLAGVAAVLAIAACSAGVPPVSRPIASGSQAPSGAVCDAARAQFAVGQPFTPALGERARQASGASSIRILRPGEAVTLEFLPDRLSLELDASERIAAVRCG